MSNIDQSLDDIIKTNKTDRSGGGARKGGRKNRAGGGPVRNAPNRLGTRHTPYSIGKSAARRSNAQLDGAGTWQHDLFEEAGAIRGKPVGIETGTKLHIENLHHGVSTDDIKELFSEVGDLKRCCVNYDRSGRSLGTAEVVFARKYDAQVAVKRYNNVQLDGKPMRIACIGTNVTKFAAAAAATNGRVRAAPAPASSRRGGGGGFKRIGGGRRKAGGGGAAAGAAAGGGGRRKSTPKTAQELDADLDNYHTSSNQADVEAMQTN